MFAVRFSRCFLRTCDSFKQLAKYSQLKFNCTERKVLFRLPKHVFTKRVSLCTVASEDSSEEYKPDVEAIAKGDPEIEKRLKLLLLEIEVLRQEGSQVPSPAGIKEEDWEELVKLRSRSGRNKFLRFLFKKEKIKESQKFKKLQKQLDWEQRKQELEKAPPAPQEGAISYGFDGSNIFLRFYDTKINAFYNSRVLQAMTFGQKLVVDCGYDQHMTKKENVNCAKQLMLGFGDNRIHDDPFDLHFCNLHEGTLKDYFKRQVPTVEEPDFPLNLHQESYMDLFPKDQLIYLTPHCRDTMDKYDHDAIYIIGAIVDKTNQEPLSLAKAKKENLRMVKFPLDKYLQWGSGSGKTLTVNQCLQILLDVKKTGDWKYALRHVPKRKLVDMNTYEEAGVANSDLRYDRRLKKFRTMWKPSGGIGKLSYNKQKIPAGGLLDDDEENDSKPKVSLKNIFK